MKNILAVLFILFSVSCATYTPPAPPAANTLTLPTPIEGNSGKYMSPYTSDDTVCEWVESGLAAKMGSQVGGAVGAYAASKALEQIPIVGGFIGQKAGSALGRKIALESMGGEEAIKDGSDLSFDNVDDLIIYTYVKHSTHPDYVKVTELIGELYPELKKRQYTALYSAPKAPVEMIASTETTNEETTVVETAKVETNKDQETEVKRVVVVKTEYKAVTPKKTTKSSIVADAKPNTEKKADDDYLEGFLIPSAY